MRIWIISTLTWMMPRLFTAATRPVTMRATLNCSPIRVEVSWSVSPNCCRSNSARILSDCARSSTMNFCVLTRSLRSLSTISTPAASSTSTSLKSSTAMRTFSSSTGVWAKAREGMFSSTSATESTAARHGLSVLLHM